MNDHDIAERFPEYVRADKSLYGSFRGMLDDIASAAVNRRLGLLLGAGFSHDLHHLPLAWELARDMVMDRLKCEEAVATKIAKRYGLAAVAQWYERVHTEKRKGLIDFVANRLQSRKPGRIEAKYLLHSIVSRCRMRRLYTTNFDTVLDECLGSLAQTVDATAKAVIQFKDPTAENPQVGVFHLCGTLDDPWVTEQDLKKESVHLKSFACDLVTDVFAFVGYDLGDDSLEKVYLDVRDTLNVTREDRKTFLVMPIENSFEYSVASEIFKQRAEIELVPMGATDFLAVLWASIQDLLYGDTVRRVVTETREEPVKIKDSLRGLKEEFEDLTHIDVGETLLELISGSAR